MCGRWRRSVLWELGFRAFETRRYARAARYLSQYTTSVDSSMDEARGFYWLGRAYRRGPKAIDAYRKAMAVDCDVCIIATPPGFRPIHHKAAIEAGKHVFMEKPCCTDAPGFNMLMETNKLADEKGLKVGVGLPRRHQGSYVDGVKEIQDGKYGDVMFTRVYWNGGGVWTRGGGATPMENQMINWYYYIWLCGDNICEQHVHNLDVGNWVMGVPSE